MIVSMKHLLYVNLTCDCRLFSKFIFLTKFSSVSICFFLTSTSALLKIFYTDETSSKLKKIFKYWDNRAVLDGKASLVCSWINGSGCEECSEQQTLTPGGNMIPMILTSPDICCASQDQNERRKDPTRTCTEIFNM